MKEIVSHAEIHICQKKNCPRALLFPTGLSYVRQGPVAARLAERLIFEPSSNALRAFRLSFLHLVLFLSKLFVNLHCHSTYDIRHNKRHLIPSEMPFFSPPKKR